MKGDIHKQGIQSKVADGRRPNTTGSRTAPWPFFSDSQSDLITDLFPEWSRSVNGGRPKVPSRDCIEGIPWVLKTRARCKNYYAGIFLGMRWRRFRQWTECGTLSPEKVGLERGVTKKGDETRIMVMTKANGLSTSAFTTSAQVAELNMIDTAVDVQFSGPRVRKLVSSKMAGGSKTQALPRWMED